MNNLPTDFNYKVYSELYDDLKNLNEIELKEHYINYGKKEGRIYKKSNNIYENIPSDFDPIVYKELNIDLKHFSIEELYSHYNNHGKKEGRIYKKSNNIYENIPSDFDPIFYKELNIDLKHFSIEELYSHYNNHGKKEGRIYKKIYDKKDNIITNKYLCNYNIPISNKNIDIIFSLTTIPDRLINDNFNTIINNLNNQCIKPKYIIINLCNKYNNNYIYDKELYQNKINYLVNNYDNIIINYSDDYYYLTKIMGLLNLKNILNDDDRIIFLNDNYYNINMSYFYSLAYDIYNCDFISVNNILNEEIKTNIFFDNHINFIYANNSYSFKFSFIQKIYDFYNELINIDENIIFYEDIFITLYYILNNLYNVTININFIEKENDTFSELFTNDYNINKICIEEKLLKKYNINYILKNDIIYLDNIYKKDYNININDNIKERKTLFNINNIEYNCYNNDFNLKHYDLKYFDKNVFIITITNFENYYYEYNTQDFKYTINNINYILNFSIENYFSRKITFFVNSDYELEKIEHNKYNFNIFQTYNVNNIDINKFYSISTILNYIPDIKYKFFNENNRINFIKNNYNNALINIYNKLNPGAYKADLFRILYLYKEGGLYFDCKNILYKNIIDILSKNECYVQDCGDGIYNAFIYCSYKNNTNFKQYLQNILYNIINSLYLNNGLEITGPALMIKYFKTDIYLKNNLYDNNWQKSYLTYINNDKILVKNSYYGYYDNNDYLNREHYSILYEQKKVYNNINIDYSKINGIDCIAWINLNRSVNRKDHMENILKFINVPNIRIEAVDGKENNNLRSLINIPFEDNNMTNYEIACSLSHIKALNILYNNYKGEYFMICEDDILFDNLYLFNEDLKKIIDKSPKFDILLIYKTYHDNLEEIYTDWNKYFNMGSHYHIAGAVSYIVSSRGLEKLVERFQYIDEKFIFKNDEIFNVSDKYIYRKIDTYVYKYNYIICDNNESTIHESHLDHHIKMKDREISIIINNKLLNI